MAVVKFLRRNTIKAALAGLLLLLPLSVSAAPAAAEAAVSPPQRVEDTPDASERLGERLAGLERYAARFEQEIRGARGEVLERSTGQMLLKRPAFRWEVDEPFPQVLVADEALLKIYDPDLEQLTIRPIDEALADTPISLLSRERIALRENFEVTRVEDADAEAFVVVPRSSEALYAEIRLVFVNATLSGLAILDHLGQFTQIRFEAEEPLPPLSAADFELKVPPGTDVIGG